MYAVEFEVDAKNGVIKIPLKYKELYSEHLKIIAIITENPIHEEDEINSFIFDTIHDPIDMAGFKPLLRDEVYEY